MCHIDKNRARDACTKGLEGLTNASCDRNENLGGERDTRSAQAVLRDALRLICVLQGERDRSLFLTCYICNSLEEGDKYLFCKQRQLRSNIGVHCIGRDEYKNVFFFQVGIENQETNGQS